MEPLNEKLFLDKYDKGSEKNRLHKGLGLIEFARTKEILLETLPPAPAVICDIGGAYGEYSYWLASLGYEVYLYDLSEKNIAMAHEFGKKCGKTLRCAEVADARSIPRPDESADAILLLGPLYHLIEKTERDKCLAECKRLLKPGGLLFTANITAYASTLHFVSVYDKKRKPALDSDDVFSGLERTVKTGVHTGGGLGFGYFHKPEELKAEIDAIYDEYYYTYYNKMRKPMVEYTQAQAKERALTAEKYGFSDIRYKMFYRERRFTAKEYVALLGTYSDQIAIEEKIRTEFFSKIAEAINGNGGVITLYDTIDLQLARK